MPLAQELERLTSLHLEGDQNALRRIDYGLRGLFETLSKGKGGLDQNRKVKHGEAISPTRAMGCINDLPRTGAFLRGTQQAIQSSRRTELRIAEIGCGPIPPTAICTALVNPNVSYDLVDIHPVNLEILEAALKHLKLDSSRFRLHSGDASCGDWSHLRPDIVVTEVMHTGLLDEPQGAITAHLAPQFPQAVWLPDEITVSARLFRNYEERSNQRTRLGQVACIDRAFRVSAQRNSLEKMIQVGTEFSIPEGRRHANQNVELTTVICIQGDIEIKRGSVLTRPRFLGTTKATHTQVHIQFKMGDTNGLAYSTP